MGKTKEGVKYKELDKALNSLHPQVNAETVIDLRRKTIAAIEEAVEESKNSGRRFFDTKFVKEYWFPTIMIIAATTLFALQVAGGGWMLFMLFLYWTT